MPSVNQIRFMPFSCAQMYELVNDVESYPQFLPWCERGEILARDPEHMRARLTLAKGRLRHSFTTENHLVCNASIDLHLIDGPFRAFNGAWRFEPRDTGCRVSLKMDFEFSNRLVAATLGVLFKKITTTLVESFNARAHELYG